MRSVKRPIVIVPIYLILFYAVRHSIKGMVFFVNCILFANYIMNFTVLKREIRGARVAQWLNRLPLTAVVPSSIPGRGTSCESSLLVRSLPCLGDFSPGSPVLLPPSKTN